MGMNERTPVDEFHAPLPVARQDSVSLMDVITRATADPTFDVTKLERLLALYERMRASDAEKRFYAALTDVQKETGRIAADAENPSTRGSKYASYAAMDRVLRPIYTKHGFALSFDTGDAAEFYVKVICHVSHADGHSRDYSLTMPADGKGAKGGDVMTKTHAAGAALSYGSRYLLKLIFNVAVGEDDVDGNDVTLNATISHDQIDAISVLIEKSGADVEKLCRYLKVDAIGHLTVKDYQRAIDALNAKLKQKVVQ